MSNRRNGHGHRPAAPTEPRPERNIRPPLTPPPPVEPRPTATLYRRALIDLVEEIEVHSGGHWAMTHTEPFDRARALLVLDGYLPAPER